MKVMLAILAALAAATGALAFDADAWHQKREAILLEAKRLKAAYRTCAGRLGTPAEDVVLPVETFPDGSVKTIIHANKAQYFLKEGLVWAEGVTLRKYQKDGTLETVIVARHCVVDRVAKAGWAKGRARVNHGKTVLEGEDVYFSSPEGYVKVFKSAKVDSTDLKLGGVRP